MFKKIITLDKDLITFNRPVTDSDILNIIQKYTQENNLGLSSENSSINNLNNQQLTSILKFLTRITGTQQFVFDKSGRIVNFYNLKRENVDNFMKSYLAGKKGQSLTPHYSKLPDYYKTLPPDYIENIHALSSYIKDIYLENYDKNTQTENLKHIKNIVEDALLALTIPGARRYGKVIHKYLRDCYSVANITSSLLNIRKVTVFGSARTTIDDNIYQRVYELVNYLQLNNTEIIFINGGGPGNMESSSRGHQNPYSFYNNIITPNDLVLGFKILFNIFEQDANPYIRKDMLAFFQTFMARLTAFMIESDCIIVTPGGIGTLLELYNALQLVQVGMSKPVPIIVYGSKEEWGDLDIDDIHRSLLANKMISEEDVDITKYFNNPIQVNDYLNTFYFAYDSIKYHDKSNKRETLLRLKFPITEELLEILNNNEKLKNNLLAANIAEHNKIFIERDINHNPLPYERNEFIGKDIYYLQLPFNLHRFGHLYDLIMQINNYYMKLYPDKVNWQRPK